MLNRRFVKVKRRTNTQDEKLVDHRLTLTTESTDTDCSDRDNTQVTVTTIAGNGFGSCVDGVGADACVDGPDAICAVPIDAPVRAGALLIADSRMGCIRCVVPATEKEWITAATESIQSVVSIQPLVSIILEFSVIVESESYTHIF